MLPEAGAFELVFLAMVALIVVGPKDLPVLLRKLGQFTAKMRGLAAEFRSSFDEMARQSELDDLRREVEALRDGRFGDAHKPDVESHLHDISAGLRWEEPSPPVLPPPSGADPLAPSAAPLAPEPEAVAPAGTEPEVAHKAAPETAPETTH